MSHYAYLAIRRRVEYRPARYKHRCPICGGPSLVRCTRHGVFGYPTVRDRLCAKGHHIAWCYAADGHLTKTIHTKVQEPLSRVCLFPGCGKPSQKESSYARRGCSRLCQGHKKQRERNGWSGLKPLEAPRWHTKKGPQ